MSRSEAFNEGRMTNRPDAVVFDMDGTLADVSGLRHLVQGPNRNFEEFHQRSVDAPPNSEVVDMARNAKAAGKKIVIVTARKAKFRPHTAMWLAQNDVPSDAMYMRADKDQRPDYEVKKDILNRMSRSFNVIHAVDDNPNVLKLWHENNIRTTRVPGWEDD